jgi:hypothetical protein
MDREVVKLAGTRSERKDDGRQYYRHSANPGSVRINHEKVLLLCRGYGIESVRKSSARPSIGSCATGSPMNKQPSG